MREGESYRGLFGAFPYAYRASDSRLFRSYVLVGGLLAALVAVVFGLAVIVAVYRTLGTGGGTFTFSRAFVLVVGLVVVLPLLAPVLLVARRHRRGAPDIRYDLGLAGAGYLFALSLYLAVLISAPPTARDPPPAPIAPAVGLLYDLPPLAGLIPPILAALLIVLTHRRLR